MVRRDREQDTHRAKIFSPTDTRSLRIGTQSTVDTQQRELWRRDARCGCSAAVSIYPVCRWCAWSAEYSGTWGPSQQPWGPMSSYCCTDVLSQTPPTENTTTASTISTRNFFQPSTLDYVDKWQGINNSPLTSAESSSMYRISRVSPDLVLKGISCSPLCMATILTWRIMIIFTSMKPCVQCTTVNHGLRHVSE